MPLCRPTYDGCRAAPGCKHGENGGAAAHIQHGGATHEAWVPLQRSLVGVRPHLRQRDLDWVGGKDYLTGPEPGRQQRGVRDHSKLEEEW